MIGMSIREPVAELFDRHDRVGQQRKFLAQSPDVDVNGSRAASVLVTPDVGQEQVP
jgi:hypothetical protein